jgi:Pyridoxamine 5'-phosphate oxidase
MTKVEVTAGQAGGQVATARAKPAGGAGAQSAVVMSRVTSAQVWRALAKASFAAVSYVTPGGEPRSSGVVYASAGKRLYAVVAADSWKARHIAASGKVAVTVPVRRGGLLSLLLPIPPATISCHAAAIVHPAGPVASGAVPAQLTSLLPAERRDKSCVIEIVPEGWFVTYGIGVSLMKMRDTSAARARLPVDISAS